MVNAPKTETERHKVAEDFAKQFTIKMPIYVDSINDTASLAFGAWPDRIYIVGTDGKVVYQGDPGPRGFNAEDIPKTLSGLKTQ